MTTKYVSTTRLQYFKTKLESLFAKKTDLSKVATSGSYNDLSNKPTIPSVGNGTITITQNGTSKGTFTTNQSGNTTIALTDSNTTYSVATTSANGLMSASDKSKLDGIASGASNISKSDILSWIYPVGSIYMSVNSTSPSSFIGGTWVQIKDTFLLACGSTYSNGKTGGEATHTLTISEMPSHRHDLRQGSYGGSYSDNAHQVWAGSDGSGWKTSVLYYNDGIQGIQPTGGGKAHNNMPPYLAVYMWKRTK